MTDEEKLQVSKEAFKWKLDQINSWTAFKALLNGLTKQQAVNFLKNRLGTNSTNYRAGATQNTSEADDLDALVGEYDGI